MTDDPQIPREFRWVAETLGEQFQSAIAGIEGRFNAARAEDRAEVVRVKGRVKKLEDAGDGKQTNVVGTCVACSFVVAIVAVFILRAGGWL